MEVRVDEFEFLEHPRKKNNTQNNAPQNKEDKSDKDDKGDKEKTDEMVKEMTAPPPTQSTMDSPADTSHIILEPEPEEEEEDDPWYPPTPPVF